MDFSFTDTEKNVQKQILSSAVKVFLKFPNETESLLTKLLENATERTQAPEIRDRLIFLKFYFNIKSAYIYWRMLSCDPDLTKQLLILSEKPGIKEETVSFEEEFLDKMIDNLGKITTTLHVLPDSFGKPKFESRIR